MKYTYAYSYKMKGVRLKGWIWVIEHYILWNNEIRYYLIYAIVYLHTLVHV